MVKTGNHLLPNVLVSFLAPYTLKSNFGRVNIMRTVLIFDEIPPVKERCFKAATELKREL